MSILKILNELASDNSRLFKEAVLKREANNETLKKAFELALNPNINFWIKQIPGYKLGNVSPELTLEQAFQRLYPLMSRMVTGNAAIDHLSETLSMLLAEDAKVIERIIARDMRCGVNDSTVNKIWKNLT